MKVTGKILTLAVLFSLLAPTCAWGQRAKRNEDDFARERPVVGDKLPSLTVYDPLGREVKTDSLRGHHVVLTFGCLT